MKCCSRSTLGIIIGCLNIFGFTVAIIYIITILAAIGSLTEEEKEENNDILTVSSTFLYILLIFCIISILTSVLLVLGIVRKSHAFMKPWICSAIVGIAFFIFRLVIAIFVGFTTGKSFGEILAALVVGLLTLGIQMLIFYPIYTLYTDIRDASNYQEQTGLNIVPQNPPSYGELEKGEEMYN